MQQRSTTRRARSAPWSALVGALAAVALLAVGGSAGALTMDPNPVGFSGESVNGSVELLEVTSGTPSGGTLLAGSSDDVTLVFEASLASGSASVDEITASVLDTLTFGCCSASGLGHFASDPGEDVTGGSLTSGGNTAIFSFASLDADETTDRFFVSYASGLLETDETQQQRFSVRNASSGGSTDTAATLVPEPGTLALFGLGLGGLGWASGRARA